jgi:hypothetical protein
VEVVYNHLKPYRIKGEANTLVLIEDYIMEIDKNEMSQLGLTDICHFDIDSKDNIYLLSSPPNTKQLFKFDPNGNFIKAFGRKNEKSGEIPWLLHPRIGINDQIIVVEGGSEKILFFNKEGTIVKEVSRSTIQEISTGIPNKRPRNSMLLVVWPLKNGNYLIFKSLNYYTKLDHYCPLIVCNSKWEEKKEIDCLEIPGFNSDKFKKIKGWKFVEIEH